jgi:ABC-type dipeptide/oligopeptide/nickel transport system permease component
MAAFILRRVGQTVVALLIVTVMIFTLARLTGDPTPLVMPSEATDADRAFFREQYGLDRSVPVQYAIFMKNVLHGDFGVSFRYREPAINLVLGALRPTLELSVLAMIFAMLIGLPLGVMAAVYPNGRVDRAIGVFSSLGQAMPSFWVGLMLILVFAVRLGWFPSSGYGTPRNFVLPVATLAFYASASIIRLTHANMREALASDFVHMERVLGISEWRVVLLHAFRNASLPIITYLGLQFGLLLGGAIVTERVFAWPGIGQTVVEAILGRDYPVVQATVFVTALLFILINLFVDVIYTVVDPRIRA